MAASKLTIFNDFFSKVCQISQVAVTGRHLDCLIYNNMISYNKQWNTLPQLWNVLISIFRSSMEFHGIPWNLPEVPWNSMEFHGTFPCQKGSSMEFHGTLKVPWNLMLSPNSMEFHGIARPRTKVPCNSMEFGVGYKFHGTFKVPWNSMELPFWPGKVPWNSIELLASSMEFHGTVKYWY